MNPSFDELDAATLRLYRSVLDSPRHGPFVEAIASLMRSGASHRPPGDVTLAIVPGAFYRENPRSGADGHVVRERAERLGWPVELIPIASTGSVAGNGATICRWLGERRDARVVLISLSKGGSDVKLALEQPGAGQAFAGVSHWINLCGILEGTPLATWLLSRRLDAVLYRLFHRVLGMGLEFLGDVRREPGGPLDFRLRLPAHLQMISVVGFPQRRHFTTATVRYCHRLMAPDGPNDGGMLLADVCAQPGLLYPVWSADHYLRSGADIGRLIEAILTFVAQTMTACRPEHSTSLATG